MQHLEVCRADMTLDLAPVAEQDKRGQRGHRVGLRRVGVSVYVHLEDEEVLPVLTGERLQVGGERTARPAPRCPKVHEDRDAVRLRLTDDLAKFFRCGSCRHGASLTCEGR